MSSIPMTVLSLRVGSFTNRSFIIFRDGSMASSVLSQAGSYLASQADSTLASSALSQAGSSQAGSSQASPADSTRQVVPRQAFPRLPQKIALYQRVQSPRQAILRLSWKKTLSQQRVSSPRAVSPLPWRIVLSRQRGLYLLSQSGALQGLGLGRQAPPLGRSVRSLSETMLFPRGIIPGQCFPRPRLLPQ